MTRLYHLKSALLPQGWASGARVTVADDGQITAVEVGRPSDSMVGTDSTDGEFVAGIVVPGMPNAHSHAFQRGMVGNTEYRRTAQDSFWTWREAMYALANRIEPQELVVLATQLFVEMLKAGYTSVAEFHYLHRRPGGEPYAGDNSLWEAVSEAAATAGIGLTLLPTLYQTSDFGSRPLAREQRRFASDTDRFLSDVQTRIAAEHREKPALRRTGVAFHSLRAVPLATLIAATRALRSMAATLPLHIHVAEQVKEVEACLAHTARRPIELLLDTGLVDAAWCLVHATHATAAELKGVAASGAAVCVSISTEANLGDGFFDAARFLKHGGRLCVGSDSQATVSPAEELRWMEYQQRLRKRRRGVLAAAGEPHVGTRLWRHAARAGAQALGQPIGAIEVGCRADWLVLDDTHPSMAGSPLDTALDRLLFGGGEAAIRDVMVGGRWVVRDRCHAAEQPLARSFTALMSQIAGMTS